MKVGLGVGVAVATGVDVGATGVGVGGCGVSGCGVGGCGVSVRLGDGEGDGAALGVDGASLCDGTVLAGEKIADAMASATTTAVSAMKPARHRSPMRPPLLRAVVAIPEAIAKRI